MRWCLWHRELKDFKDKDKDMGFKDKDMGCASSLVCEVGLLGYEGRQVKELGNYLGLTLGLEIWHDTHGLVPA